MTPTEGARKMMAERGYVVLAFYPDTARCIGDIENNFSGGRIVGARLKLAEPSNKKEWDAQLLAIFGDKHKNQKFHQVSTAQFWRAVLEEKT